MLIFKGHMDSTNIAFQLIHIVHSNKNQLAKLTNNLPKMSALCQYKAVIILPGEQQVLSANNLFRPCHKLVVYIK